MQLEAVYLRLFESESQSEQDFSSDSGDSYRDSTDESVVSDEASSLGKNITYKSNKLASVPSYGEFMNDDVPISITSYGSSLDLASANFSSNEDSEADEWSDVLSFFCGDENFRDFEYIQSYGSMRRNTSGYLLL
jgi:hypothetical protein